MRRRPSTGLSILDRLPLIMVVDDEADITETYALYFSLHDFEVVTANDAVRALALISERVPDLIISDCMMPYMDGVEFSRRVKANPATRHVPIILMSGAPDLHDLSIPSYEAFLVKPVLLPILMQEMARLLK